MMFHPPGISTSLPSSLRLIGGALTIIRDSPRNRTEESGVARTLQPLLSVSVKRQARCSLCRFPPGEAADLLSWASRSPRAFCQPYKTPLPDSTNIHVKNGAHKLRNLNTEDAPLGTSFAGSTAGLFFPPYWRHFWRASLSILPFPQ